MALQRSVTLSGKWGDAQRLADLQLALTLPRSWPTYWLSTENAKERVAEILDATKDETLPWEL